MSRARTPCLALMAMVLFSLSAAAQVPAPTPLPAPQATAAATVNGQPIGETILSRGMERVPAARRNEIRTERLNYLIDNVLVEQYLVALKVEVDPADVQKKLDEMKANLKKEGKDYAKTLEETKITEAELREHLTAELRWEKFVAGRATEPVLRQQFDGNKEMFDGTMVRARHILLSTTMNDPKAVEQAKEQLAAARQQVEAKVAAGLAKLPANSDNLAREKARTSLTDEAFAAAAAEKSACPSKTQGGDVGWFQRSGIMVEPFARAAFVLKPYTMSDIVQTRFGCHLILLTERKNGQEVKFEDVKDDVREYYGDRLREAVVAQMRPRSRIEITKP